MRAAKVAMAIVIAVLLIAGGSAVVRAASSYSLGWLTSVAGTGPSLSRNYGLSGVAGQSVVGSASSVSYGLQPVTGTVRMSIYHLHLPAVLKAY
ncbi:MAG: hypothetical protein HYX94_03600 [Chloroflexi bacterium]|nr:hypothetical protein [Chloroflexota bacterium]